MELNVFQILKQKIFSAKCGSSQYSYSDQWNGGANGKLLLTFPASAANGWTIKVQFSSNVNSLTIYSGKYSKCISATVCTFSNAGN